MISVVQTCDPPFGQVPNCFSLGFFLITSEDCALAYARMFNVTDVASLVNIANTVDAIHTACNGVTTEVRPRSSACGTAVAIFFKTC